MSDKDTEMVQDATPEPEAQDAPVVEPGKDGTPFDAERAQALIDKLREENKAAKAAAKKLAEYEAAEQKRKEAEMTELEKLTAQNAELAKKIEQAERREMQRAAGDKYKLPAEFTELLKGTTPEEMEAHAKKLADALPKTAKLNPTNPPAGGLTETREQKRARLLGTDTSLFKGGGIKWPEGLPPNG